MNKISTTVILLLYITSLLLGGCIGWYYGRTSMYNDLRRATRPQARQQSHKLHGGYIYEV